MTKKLFLLIIISVSIVFILSTQPVFAREGRPLEIQYPEIEGFKPEKDITPIPDYVKYIFNFAIWISGFIALAVLIYAGFNYFTSAGNPEKIRDAKDRITAAFLGLVILFGSYLVLITINPELVSFHLKRLSPMISSLPPGVLLCKEVLTTEGGDDAIYKAWDLMEEHKYTNPDIDRQKEIQEELDLILEDVAEKCYTVYSKGDIRGSFDNKVRAVYFIPFIWTKGEWEYETEYGAILYEDRKYNGTSVPMYGHLIDPAGGWRPYRREVSLDCSSIKPFELIYEPDENWEVVLYQKSSFNKDFPDLVPFYGKCGSGSWWCEFNLSWPPESIKVEGDIMAVLYKPSDGGGPYGPNATFFNGEDNYLLDDDNIVNYKPCISHPIKGCPVAAAKLLAIIAAKPY